MGGPDIFKNDNDKDEVDLEDVKNTGKLIQKDQNEESKNDPVDKDGNINFFAAHNHQSTDINMEDLKQGDMRSSTIK